MKKEIVCFAKTRFLTRSFLVFLLVLSFCGQGTEPKFVLSAPEPGPITQAQFGKDPDKLLTQIDQSKNVVLWQVGNPNPLFTLGHGEAVQAITWASHEESIMTCMERSCFYWHFTPNTTGWTYGLSWVADAPTTGGEPILAAGFIPRMPWIWVLREQKITFVDRSQNKVMKTFTRDRDIVASSPFFDVSPAGDRFLYQAEGQMQELHLPDFSLDLTQPSSTWKWALFNADGSKIIALVQSKPEIDPSGSYHLLAFDLTTRSQSAIGTAINPQGLQTFRSPNNEHIFFISASLGFLDLDMKSLGLTYYTHTPVSSLLCISPQAQFIVYSDTQTVKLWSKKGVDTILPKAISGQCSFSSDEHWLVATTSEGVALWDVTTL